MLPSLDVRSPRSRIVLLAAAFILAPGIVLGVLGFRSIADRATALRTNYVATVSLVRDRLEAELQRLGSQLTAEVDAFVAPRTDPAAPFPGSLTSTELSGWLQTRTAENEWIESAFFVHRDGGVMTASLSSGWPTEIEDPLASNPLFGRLIREAEAAEYAGDDLVRAADLYRDALGAAGTPAQRCLALTRAGRTLFKAGGFNDGISLYREVLELGPDVVGVTGAPCRVIALGQIADGLSTVGAGAESEKAGRDLVANVVAHPWDLQRQYAFYLERVSGAVDQHSPLYGDVTTLVHDADEVEWIRTQVVPRLRIAADADTDGGTSPAFASAWRPYHNVQVGYRTFGGRDGEPRDRADAAGILAFGYTIRSDHVSDVLLPQLLESVDLGPGRAIGMLDRQGRWHGDPTAVAAVVDSVAADQIPNDAALAEATLEQTLPGWTVALVDSQGRSITQIVARENRVYAVLMIGLVVVLAAGVAFTLRAASHEIELSRLKSDFVANVTHELKTPLALIRMYGETLESGLVDDEVERREFFAIMRRESERLTHLINNVLDFGKIDSGAKEYSFASEDIVAVVRESVEAYRYFFDRLGAEVETDFPADPIPLPIDRDAIAQSLVNLLHNALKYGGDGGYVGVSVRAEDGDALVEVTDRGVGIPESQLALIFEKYHRVEGTEKVAGSGLGLAIVKHAVEAHGGSVEVQSSPRSGSRFMLRLPVTPAVDATADTGKVD